MKSFFVDNKKTIYLFLSFFCFMFLSEILFKIIVLNEYISIYYLRIILNSIFYALILSLFISLFNYRITRLIVYVLLFTINLYAFIQIIYYKLMKNFLTFQLAGMTGDILDFIDDALSYFRLEYLLLFIPFILFIYISKKYKLFEFDGVSINIVVTFTSLTLIVFLSSLLTLNMSLFKDKYSPITDRDLYMSLKYQQQSLDKFGFIKYLQLDSLYSFVPGFLEVSNKDKEELVFKEDNKSNLNTNINNSYDRLIDDSIWKVIINGETDVELKNINNYLISREITPKNEMTGIFKDKNLILIMAEAFDQTSINETFSPTLYKMAQEGIVLANNYSPMYSCATGDSEFIGLTSIIPVSNDCAPNLFKDNTYSVSLAELFKDKFYYSTSYHSYIDKWYMRNSFQPSIGFTYYDMNKLDLKGKTGKGWPSDVLLMKAATPYFIDQERFFTFIISASGHFPYENDYATIKKNINVVKDIEASEQVKNYFATQVELNNALEYLIDELKAKNKLNDTVIMIYGDHYPFKLPVAELNKFSQYNDRTKPLNANNVPIIIWTPNMKHQEIRKISDTFDILPTIANLFDLDYDPRYYMGTDVFSKNEGLAIFPNGSWISDKGRYDAPKAKFYPTNPNDTISDDYVININKMLELQNTMSSKILYKNYYKYRFNQNK